MKLPVQNFLKTSISSIRFKKKIANLIDETTELLRREVDPVSCFNIVLRIKVCKSVFHPIKFCILDEFSRLTKSIIL